MEGIWLCGYPEETAVQRMDRVIGGFGQICLRQDEPVSARIAFEKALLVNPHLDGVREIVHELGAEFRPVMN